MANKEIQKYARMVNLQMAAEAFWQDIQIGRDILDVATRGNTVNSLEPKAVANLFVIGATASPERGRTSATS